MASSQHADVARAAGTKEGREEETSSWKRPVENGVSAHLFIGNSTTQLGAMWKEGKESGPCRENRPLFQIGRAHV